MASLQMMKPGFSAFPRSKVRESRCFSLSEFDYGAHHKGFLRSRSGVRKVRRVSCQFQDANSQNNGDEPPESLFMKELKRRGITPTSLLEESNRSTVDEEIKERGGDRSFSKRNSVATGSDRSLTNQREESMALNSEGLEGLIPRAKLLLTLGATFFLAFWPLILLTIASFAAVYLYFGPSFIHDGTDMPVAPPQYIDPYTLLEDERIGQ